ncbi:hypothetical protein ABK040_011559 [Willaertia magna]
MDNQSSNSDTDDDVVIILSESDDSDTESNVESETSNDIQNSVDGAVTFEDVNGVEVPEEDASEIMKDLSFDNALNMLDKEDRENYKEINETLKKLPSMKTLKNMQLDEITVETIENNKFSENTANYYTYVLNVYMKYFRMQLAEDPEFNGDNNNLINNSIVMNNKIIKINELLNLLKEEMKLNHINDLKKLEINNLNNLELYSLKWNAFIQSLNLSFYKILLNNDKSIEIIQSPNMEDSEYIYNILLKIIPIKNQIYQSLQENTNIENNIYNLIKELSIEIGFKECNKFKNKLKDKDIELIYKKTFELLMNDEFYFKELNKINELKIKDLYKRIDLTKLIISQAQLQTIISLYNDHSILMDHYIPNIENMETNNSINNEMNIINKEINLYENELWLHYRLSLEEWYHCKGCLNLELIDLNREFHDWLLDIIVGKYKKKNRQIIYIISILIGISIIFLLLFYFMK